MTIDRSDRVSPYPDPEVLAYMEQQADLFDRAKPQLIETYLDRYV